MISSVDVGIEGFRVFDGAVFFLGIFHNDLHTSLTRHYLAAVHCGHQSRNCNRFLPSETCLLNESKLTLSALDISHTEKSKRADVLLADLHADLAAVSHLYTFRHAPRPRAVRSKCTSVHPWEC